LSKKSDALKVLMTTDNLGGVWTYSIELLSEFEKNNIYTALAIMGSPLTQSQRKQLAKLKKVKVYHSEYKLEWMEDPWEDVDMAGEWLLTIRDEFHPDLVHLNSYTFGALNWGVPVIVIAHSDVISWWKSVLNCPHPNRLNEYLKRVKFGLENSNWIVAPSKNMLKKINEIYGNFINQGVIYNGRSKEHIVKSEKQKLIFSMGRLWDTAKNVSLLIKAAPMLKWKVKLAGNPQHPITNELTVHGNVDFLGGLTETEVFEYLSISSIFIHPARYEPFGLAPLEAALSGCALVLGDIDSLKEVWEDSALYVDTDDSKSVVDVVNRLINDEDLLMEYSQKANERAQKYTTGKMFSEYMEIYKNILNREEIFQKDSH
jgi:glycogen synthase